MFPPLYGGTVAGDVTLRSVWMVPRVAGDGRNMLRPYELLHLYSTSQALVMPPEFVPRST